MERILGTNAKNVLRMAVATILALIACAPPAAIAATERPVITINQVFVTSGESDVFTYRLIPVEKDSPMPEGSTAEGYTFTIAGTSSAMIELASYSREGAYRYKLFQVIGTEKQGYVYDKRVYTIEIYVYEELYVIVVVYNEDFTKAGTITFRNSYSGSGTIDPPPTAPPPTDPPPTEPPPTDPPPIDPPPTELPPTEPPTTEEPPTELPPTNPPGGGGEGGSLPKTGDESKYGVYLGLFVLGAAGSIGAAIYLIVGRKRESEG